MLYFNSKEERKEYNKKRAYNKRKAAIYRDLDKVIGTETNRTERLSWNCRIPYAYGETKIKYHK